MSEGAVKNTFLKIFSEFIDSDWQIVWQTSTKNIGSSSIKFNQLESEWKKPNEKKLFLSTWFECLDYGIWFTDHWPNIARSE